MAHTGKVNTSERPRLGLPIAFTPIHALKKIIDKNNFQVTDIGKKVFDL